jgi:hypothetical protein
MTLFLAALITQVPADFFPLGDGMKWTYETGDGKESVKTVATSDAGWKIEGFGPWGVFRETVVVSKDLSVVKLAGSKADVPWLKSVKKGETWSAKAALGDVGCDFAFEVLGDETVDVPAGKYACVRVKVAFSDGEGTTGEWTLWYAKDAGEVKSAFVAKSRGREEKFERRLKSFAK